MGICRRQHIRIVCAHETSKQHKTKTTWTACRSNKYVKAKAQADILSKIENELTEKELEIVKRGRNAENHHLPKNATVQEYMYSTGFEALIGYLYLTKQDERLEEILGKCI